MLKKHFGRCVVCLFLISLVNTAASGQIRTPPKRYEPDCASLDQRPIPEWFNEAKFGIFVVWGPYSVPAYAPSDGYAGEAYAEWYGKRIEQEGSAAQEFHFKNYGKDFKYEQFADMFRAEMWDPDFWAHLFVKAGAKYVVTTANYHDGFALWPTKYARTVNTDQWQAMLRGPKRDLLGELNEAGRKRGLKMGIYYSLYEWWHPLWLTDRDRYVTEHLHPKFKEVVTKYKPPVIFLDGEWEMDYKRWRSEELAAWLFNDSPVAYIVVVNDRWGQTRSQHGSYFSSEYGGGEYPPTHPWQEDRGIGHSYGYNRDEEIDDYDTGEDLIRRFSKICGNSGNFLLDVGPTADGRIPVIMQDRLLQIGRWLKVNGEAIYGSKANPFWPRQFPWGTCTSKPGRIFVHLHDRERDFINLRGLRSRIRSAYLLSDRKRAVRIEEIPEGVRLVLPEYLPHEPVSIIALEFSGDIDVDTTPYQYDDGRVFLHCYSMKIHGGQAKVEFDGYRRMVHISNWTDPEEWISADFHLRTPGKYEVQLTYSSDKASAGSAFTVSLNGQTVSGKSRDTGDWNKYQTVIVGQLSIDRPGQHRLSVRPQNGSAWKGMGLQSVTLSKAE